MHSHWTLPLGAPTWAIEQDCLHSKAFPGCPAAHKARSAVGSRRHDQSKGLPEESLSYDRKSPNTVGNLPSQQSKKGEPCSSNVWWNVSLHPEWRFSWTAGSILILDGGSKSKVFPAAQWRWDLPSSLGSATSSALEAADITVGGPLPSPVQVCIQAGAGWDPAHAVTHWALIPLTPPLGLKM